MSLRKGQGVTLDGYVARSHLNGQTGTLEHRDPATGRFRVRLSETPWQTVKAVDHQCQPAEGGRLDGLSASSVLTAGRTPRLEGDQAPGTAPGMSRTFHPAASSNSPATPRQEPKHLRLLESRAKRGQIRVKDELRAAVRMDVTRDKTLQDVHRLRNAGLTFFREADAERGPRSHADPVPKPRRAPDGRVVLLPSSELQSLFEESEDRRFRHQMTQPRLPYSINPRTPGDSDEEDCELCRLEQEKAQRQAEEERHIEEHAFDECEVCIQNRERAEQEAREQEERLRAFLERTDRAKEETQPRPQQRTDRAKEETQPRPQQLPQAPQETAAPLGQSQGRRKSRDDYDDFEADSEQQGSHHSQSQPPAEPGQQPPGQEDDYEAFEDDSTWVPGRRPSVRGGAAEAAPPAAAAPAQASGGGGAAAAAAGGAGPEGGAPVVPRRASALEHADSILEDQSERELLKEHLLSALTTGAPSPAPAVAAAAAAPSAEAAAAGTQAQSGPPAADDYGEDAFE